MEKEKGLLKKIMDLRRKGLPDKVSTLNTQAWRYVLQGWKEWQLVHSDLEKQWQKRVFAFIRFETEEEANLLEEDHEDVVEYKYRFPDLDQNGTQDPFLSHLELGLTALHAEIQSQA